MSFQRRRREAPEINITSLIDIIFIILIFLLLTTTFSTSTGIEVNLPEATRRKLENRSKPVYVGVNRDGVFYLGKRRLGEKELEAALARVVRERPGALFIIRADEEARHRSVVRAMDLAKKAGVRRIAIEALGK